MSRRGSVRAVTLVAEETTGPHLDLEVLSSPHGGAFMRDYLAGAPQLARYYQGHPGDPEAYRRKAAEVTHRLDAAARARCAGAIEPLGDAADRLARILSGDGFFVTTGQQPALFGGPLYTLYKALAAVRLAAVLEPVLGRPVLALFWIGADDHDWAEANHVSVLDRDAYVQRLEVRAPADAPPLPLSERAWGSDIARAVARLGELVHGLPHADEVMLHVRSAYTADATVADSFARTMRFLLRDTRIAMISSADPALRRAAASVMRHEAANAAAHHLRLELQTERLAADGYPAQVALTPDATNLMLIDAHGRDRLVRNGRSWQTRRMKQGWTEAALLARIEAEPERFSPNVLLRPVVESAVLPTVAYVAGPGELRYFAQIGCLFEAHAVMPPVVVPRPSLTLLDARTRRLLDRLQLEAGDARAPYHELVAAVIRRELPQRAVAALERLRSGLYADYTELLAAVEHIDPTLRGPLTGARNRSLMQVNDAEKRILRHLKRRNDVLLEQLRRVAASLQPHGAPQERVLGPLPWLAWHGRALIGRVAASLDMEPRLVARWQGVRCD